MLRYQTVFTTTMETSLLMPPREGSGGGVLLSLNLYTVVDSIGPGKSVWTRGKGAYYDFRNDTSLCDTTCLNLGGFLGRTVQVNFFCVSTNSETLFVVVEQALSYQPPSSDSALAHLSPTYFNRGFRTTDTLFVDSLEVTLDMFITNPTSSYGDMAHFYTDDFMIYRPYVRLKITNKGPGDGIGKPKHIELYIRQKDEVMSGASGRQFDRWYAPGGALRPR